MSAMAILIASACIGASGNGKEACNKGLEAGAKQTGIERSVNKFEDIVQDKADDKARDIFGETGVHILGGGVYIAKVIADKSVSFRLPTLGICDRIVSTAKEDGGNLLFEWRF